MLKSLDEIVGQDNIKKRIEISIEACRQKNTPFPHTILSGFSGGGKTTIGSLIAKELGSYIEICNGASINEVGDILPYLSRIESKSILLIDEVHNLNRKVCEFLYNPLAENVYHIGTDKKVTIELPPFTCIATTTNIGMLPKALVNRFIFVYELLEYTTKELAQIILQYSQCLDLSFNEDSCVTIAECSRGIPRTALSRLKWIYDYGVFNKLNTINPPDVKLALKIAKIGEDGTETNDKRYLDLLKTQAPLGLNTIASSLNIDVKTITEVIEPFLLQKQLIKKTQKGRCLV